MHPLGEQVQGAHSQGPKLRIGLVTRLVKFELKFRLGGGGPMQCS